MANILVYLERARGGLHPASQLALCLARDICSQRGATLVAACAGDGGDFDRNVAREAGHRGADLLVFVGPRGLGQLMERLRPRHALFPATEKLSEVLDNAGIEHCARIWLDDPDLGGQRLPAHVAIHAGGLPWYEFDDVELEPEYAVDVRSATVPEWVTQENDWTRPAKQIFYVQSKALDEMIVGELQSIGARAVADARVQELTHGTLLYFPTRAGPLPPALIQRAPQVHCILFPGPNARIDASWDHAEWILPGRWDEAVRQLHSQPWKSVLI